MDTDDNDSPVCCPLCLNLMVSADISLPIPCPNDSCKFNFCMSCISNLITSSKDELGMASDGNLAVKVKQNCPQCRADLSSVLQSTFDARRQIRSEEMKDENDSDLNATELRLKYMYRDSDESNKGSASAIIDTAIFGGLEYFMTDSEQSYVFQLMISGDVNSVAQAVTILESIAVMSRNGRRPVQKIDTFQPKPVYSNSNMRRPTSRAEMTNSRALAMTHTAKQQKEEQQRAAIRAHRKKHPLPVRMPLCATFTTSKTDIKYGYGLSVTDDDWDGSISDAFRRAIIKKGEEMSFSESEKRSRKLNSYYIGNVIDYSQLHGRDGQKSDVVENMLVKTNVAPKLVYREPKHRVIVSKVRAQAGQHGIQKGDVVTHLDGEIFEGSAEDFMKVIEKFVEGDTFSIVLNAEPAVAESLRIRSLCFGKY